MSQPNLGNEQIRTFESREAAESWHRGAAARAKWLGPATDRMLDLADVRRGSRVLDIAAGTGEQALSAAHRVGPNGYVLATDISSEMLEVAAALAREMGLRNFETRTADAQDLRVEPHSFDAAISRLGLMFIPDITRGLQEVRRALKPGAKFTAIVWASAEKNPYLTITAAVVRQRRAAAGLPVFASGAIPLSDPDLLGGALRIAGFGSVKVVPIPHTRRFASAVEARHNLFEEMPVPAAQARDLVEQEREAAFAEIEARYLQFQGPGGIELPGECLVGVGSA